MSLHVAGRVCTATAATGFATTATFGITWATSLAPQSWSKLMALPQGLFSMATPTQGLPQILPR